MRFSRVRVNAVEAVLVSCMLSLVLLNPICSAFANSVDPDQLASKEAN